ncbi:MAG: hypothetical protein IPJ65_07595 [Archangiaceae bacterium]|nr:hypothetical protein [Archangiaceae bacterium]
MKRFLPVFLLTFAARALAADPVELTQDEFKMFRHYQQAMEDPRVQKLKEDQRAAAIAKDAKFKLKDMQAAVARAEAAGDFKGKCEGNIREALGKGPLAGRIGKVEVDISEPHAVAYVQWLNENTEKLSVEASLVAVQTNAACPILSTIQVWAQDKATPKVRVFQALISSSAAAKINVEKVNDFAQTRYIRLFEKLKSVANGDDLSAESGTPTAQGGG